MGNLRFRTGVLLFLASFALAGFDVQAAEKAPRLKYRTKGSVCGCANGLSGAEIERAMAREDLDRLQAPTEEGGVTMKSELQTRREADDERK